MSEEVRIIREASEHYRDLGEQFSCGGMRQELELAKQALVALDHLTEAMEKNKGKTER